MLNFDGMKMEVVFTQPLIDWFNINYPERNFFVCAPTTVRPGDLTQTTFVKAEEYVMEDFIYGPEIFFKLGQEFIETGYPLNDEQLKEVEKFLHALARWLLKLEFDRGEQPNIFLSRVKGEVTMLDDQSYVNKITDKSLGIVGVKWTLRGNY